MELSKRGRYREGLSPSAALRNESWTAGARSLARGAAGAAKGGSAERERSGVTETGSPLLPVGDAAFKHVHHLTLRGAAKPTGARGYPHGTQADGTKEQDAPVP